MRVLLFENANKNIILQELKVLIFDLISLQALILEFAITV